MAAGTLVRRVLLQINADDGDTEEKLDRISAKADEFGRKHPELKVRIDTAEASAKVAVLRSELRGLSRQEDEMASKGLLSRLLGGAGGAGGGGGGGGLAGMLPDGAILPALLAIVPAAEAALVEITGLVSGFAAAAAGAGAFALLALPAFKKVSGAYTQIHADQLAYNRALTAASRNTALKHLHQDWAALDPAERGAIKGIQGLTGEYDKLSKAFEPQVMKIFNDGLRLANELLPDVVPFANTFANSLGGLLKQGERFAGSQGFKDWLGQFRKLEGPSIHAIGEGIGSVATALGKLLTTENAADVVNAINIAFSVLRGTVEFTAYAVHNLMVHYEEFMSFLHRSNSDIHDDAHNVSHWFDGIRHATANLAHNSASYFDEMRGNVHRWYSDVASDGGRVISWFGQLPGRILHKVSGFGHLLFSAGQDIIHGLIGGIESMASSAIGEIENVGSGMYHAALSFLHIGSPSRLFYEIGAMISAGLTLGIRESAQQAINESRKLAAAVKAAYLSGEITGPQEAELEARIGRDLAAVLHRIAQRTAAQAKVRNEISLLFQQGLMAHLTGTPSQVNSGISKLAEAVKREFEAGLISFAQAGALTRFLQADDTKLHAIATRRAAILREIAQAQQYSARIVTSTESTFGLVSAAGSITPALGAGGILRQLFGDVAQIRTFRNNIAKLKRMGLNRAYIDQLIQAGPVTGGQIAAELAAGSESDIRQVNKAESEIAKASVSLGHTAADAMYDSGKMAGKGFLSGLQSQQRQLEREMRVLARAMVAELRRELGIKSPSEVMREHGRMIGAGLALGITDSGPLVTAAMRRMARSTAPGSGAAAAGAGGAHVIIEFRGLPREIRTLLKKSIRTTGGNVAVLGL